MEGPGLLITQVGILLIMLGINHLQGPDLAHQCTFLDSWCQTEETIIYQKDLNTARDRMREGDAMQDQDRRGRRSITSTITWIYDLNLYFIISIP